MYIQYIPELFSLALIQHLLHYMLTLSRWVDTQSWTKSRLPVISLSLLQDSYHTTLPLSHPPHKMATAVLYLAILCCRLVIPGVTSHTQTHTHTHTHPKPSSTAAIENRYGAYVQWNLSNLNTIGA